jgi:homogentisate 1,2-dioxygenase
MREPACSRRELSDGALSPNRLRWNPLELPEAPTDLIDGLVTMVANRSPEDLEGVAVHVYRANRSMEGRYFFNADGEMLFIPQLGRVAFDTEMGRIEVGPGEVALIPRGVRFRASLPDGRRGAMSPKITGRSSGCRSSARSARTGLPIPRLRDARRPLRGCRRGGGAHPEISREPVDDDA